jgi:hypothetical protein
LRSRCQRVTNQDLPGLVGHGPRAVETAIAMGFEVHETLDAIREFAP